VSTLDASNPANLERAARVLKEGGVVAFPTETVYGLGANAFDTRAVARVFEIKQRPAFDPLIVHVASRDSLRALWRDVPAAAERLMDAFWPGPLTIVLPKSDAVPDLVTSGLPTVAVRMPKNAHALVLIARAGCAVAAPSANPFGRTSPTTAAAVAEELGDAVDVILDGGTCEVGVESTVVKLDGDKAVLLRPGGVTAEALREFVTLETPPPAREGGGVESPGRLESHYAPRTPLILLDGPRETLLLELATIREHAGHQGKHMPRVGLLAFGPGETPSAFDAVENVSRRGDLREAAANLFQAMRKLDKMGLDWIVAERVPGEGLGAAILDRLTKASTK
jgi:L-threonylcarbamoyladenylate synthase